MKKQPKRIAIALVLITGLSALSAIAFPKDKKTSHNIRLENVSIKQLNWDQIAVQFELIDEEENRILTPNQTQIKIYRENGTLVAHSFGKRILLNDASLASEEPLKIEIEVTAAGKKIKHIETIKASRKQLNFNQIIVYPLRKQLYAGTYDITPVLHRQKFGSEMEYEQIPVKPESITCLLTVENKESKNKIMLPIKTGKAKFKLSDAPFYQEFIPELENALVNNGGVQLKFSVQAVWNDVAYEGYTTEMLLAFNGVSLVKQPSITVIKTTQYALAKNSDYIKKPSEGSLSDLQRFISKVANQMPEAYNSLSTNVKFNIQDWRFDVSTNKYEANVLIQWQNVLIQEEKYLIKGTIVVDKTGSRLAFKRSYANQTILDIEKYNKVTRELASLN